MRKWNDLKLEKHFNRIKQDAVKDGFIEEELSHIYLDKISKQTKSARIMRLIRWAYWLGKLRGIDSVDQGKTPITIR